MHRSQVWFHEEEGELEEIEFCGGVVIAHSQRDPTKSSPNEDVAGLVQLGPDHGLLAVADGVGGANAGDAAARIVIETLMQHVSSATTNESLRSEILDAIESANQLVLDLAVGAGATLAVVEFRAGHLRAYHVGDATALVCSNHGRIKFSTVSHAPVAMAVEIGLLDEVEALTHEDRHIINNCVGSAEMKIEIGPQMPMAARDTLIVGSDGLFDNLTTEEIVDLVRAGELHPQVARMLTITNSRMRDQREQTQPSKPDDLTFLCFRQ